MTLKSIFSLGLLIPTLTLVACVKVGPLSATTALEATAVDAHIRGADRMNSLTNSVVRGPANLKAGVFQQMIDHAGGADGKTFAQRYWVDSEFATTIDAPVLYHICGEGDAEFSYFLTDNSLAWAKQLGARVVFLEHRYYGKSQPFNDLSSAHLNYLTLANVMEDLAYFQKAIAAKQGWTGKWISIGGSYSGTLSALYRQKHPELVVGALASSAPMIAGLGDEVGDANDADSFSSTDASNDDSGRQWIYQACTTFGFWQADGGSIDASLQRPSAWLCRQVFGNIGLVDVAAYNQSFDSPFITAGPSAPSNILFTYGSEDIWTKSGLLQQTIQNPQIAVQLIPGAGHHYDLNAASGDDNDAVIAARAAFVSAAKKWIADSH